MENLLTCCCLNVQLHMKFGAAEIPFNNAELCQSSEFFKNELMEVELSLDAIHIEMTYFVSKNICSEKWIIHKCDICNIFTHALLTSETSSTGAIVLINNQLLRNQQNELIQLPNYSQLFKIVVPSDKQRLQSTAVITAMNSTSNDVQHILQSIENLAITYLDAEKDAMMENIRIFSEKERANFADLRHKVLVDKNIMIDAYLNLSEQRRNEINVDNNNLDDTNSTVQKLSSLLVTGDDDVLTLTSRLSKQDVPVEQCDVSSNQQYDSSLQTYDDVFDFDPGFQEDPGSQPFSSQSDDDDEQDDDDITPADSFAATSSGITGIKNAAEEMLAVFSTSVPINVPQWKMTHQLSHTSRQQDHVDMDGTTPKDMAASIQALARSVHGGDSATVFGELPKSRNRHSHGLPSQTSTD